MRPHHSCNPYAEMGMPHKVDEHQSLINDLVDFDA